MSLAVEVQSLSKIFLQDARPIKTLDNISLSVESGAIFGIIGLSGAGKTTLLRCISTLDPSFSGTILIEGKKVDFQNTVSIQEIRKQIGMIFQHFLLLESRNVLENVYLPLELAKVPLEEREKKALDLLQLVGLDHKSQCYPSNLSGGEKQRVAIARALITSPRILFCDEITSSLDPKTTQEILHLLKNLHEEKRLTIILITHEMDVVRKICHKVAVLDQGKIIEQGSVVDIFSNPEKKLTKQLVQASPHELTHLLLQDLASHSLLVRLHFKGESAKEPILSKLISSLAIEINILSGWIDMIHSVPIGSLTITMQGSTEQKKEAFEFLAKHNVHYEVLHDA